ncbi:MAG: SDR family oxidoreductase [Lachnospiraceae bacterium]|nr:SDR family oxidoreductase [Lachnospiraceae bacterium]
MKNIDFTNKTVFLTGGSGGIGKDVKDYFEQLNAAVIAPDMDELNLLSSDSIRKYLNAHKDLKIDIFVHCAGINKLSEAEDLTIDLMESVYRVNVSSAVELLSNFIPYMKKQNYGKILFITSLYSIVSREKRAPYSASKSSLLGVTRTLALELAPYNIMVNSVAPGYVDTEMTRKNLSSKEIEEIEMNIPTGRLQRTEEISDVIGFLCSDLNKSITGQQVAVDGGFTCR